ncbi:hypothetical protein ACMU_18390 [Actibacterium mucosum KCTC 23349]|uniref:Sulfatase N-terminal domain-containing protein n=1 Tax=Actibacterium mucosum KCTC 23349 TaxID=1454373 RepID=A0A037ZE72_9RHOB|nr:sulfatase [Actibacterium mucosum]KAJ54397.1 hypothetical protein ACMU_18390 [Actibacterium mucosum KCTC 23349]
MKTVFLLFDSLNRHFLQNAETLGIPTPNFDRLTARSVSFTNHFVGSMPCMPARRDIMTGRLNFLHRGWGPLEPFDNAFPAILNSHGIHTHLSTDHYHYFEEGGATYHTQYSSFEFFRGQERDPWKADVSPDMEKIRQTHHRMHLQSFDAFAPRLAYVTNRAQVTDDTQFPSVQCFQAGLDFLETNHAADNWFLQIETFDPHEPFHAPDAFRRLFNSPYDGPILEWPKYGPVNETDDEIAELRANYAALLCLCDAQLGRVLDAFDQYGLWDNTALVVTTDHGFLLGEHDYWGKGQMPLYKEIAHIPLYMHHPDTADRNGGTCDALTQNIDLMPTFLQFHDAAVPPHVDGVSLLDALKNGNARDIAIYGYWGSGVNATDGQYSYFWYPENDRDAPLYQYTLMPTNMASFFDPGDLAQATLVNEFSFTNGTPVLKVPLTRKDANILANIEAPSQLFDIQADPLQTRPLNDTERQGWFQTHILTQLRANEAPAELYARFARSAQT